MAVTEHLAGSQTCVITTEHTLNTTTPDLTDGAFQLMLDLNALVEADILEIRIKEKVQNTSGTIRVVWFDTVAHTQGEEKAWVSPVLMLIHGWDMTLKQTAGTGRAVPWSIRKA